MINDKLHCNLVMPKSITITCYSINIVPKSSKISSPCRHLRTFQRWLVLQTGSNSLLLIIFNSSWLNLVFIRYALNNNTLSSAIPQIDEMVLSTSYHHTMEVFTSMVIQYPCSGDLSDPLGCWRVIRKPIVWWRPVIFTVKVYTWTASIITTSIILRKLRCPWKNTQEWQWYCVCTVYNSVPMNRINILFFVMIILCEIKLLRGYDSKPQRVAKPHNSYPFNGAIVIKYSKFHIWPVAATDKLATLKSSRFLLSSSIILTYFSAKIMRRKKSLLML